MQLMRAEQQHKAATGQLEQLQPELEGAQLQLREAESRQAAEAAAAQRSLHDAAVLAEARAAKQVEQGLQALRWELQTAKVSSFALTYIPLASIGRHHITFAILCVKHPADFHAC